MAQHDMNVANADGATVRADINSALAALVGNNSGATEPSTTFAYMWWADTGNGLLKIRNAANSAWVTVGTLASANLGHLVSGDIGSTVQAYDANTVKKNVANTFSATQTPYRATATASAGASYTWTLTAGQVLELTFAAGNITTLSVTGGVAGTFYTLYLKQDSVGGRTTGWSGFKWPSGTVPTLSTGANAIDIFTFYYDGTSMCMTGKSQGVA